MGSSQSHPPTRSDTYIAFERATRRPHLAALKQGPDDPLARRAGWELTLWGVEERMRCIKSDSEMSSSHPAAHHNTSSTLGCRLTSLS